MGSGVALLHPACIRGRAGAVTANDVSRLARAAYAQRFTDLDAMRTLAERSEMLSRSLPDTRRGRDARARALGVLGNVYRIRADYPEASRALDRALEFWGRGSANRSLGACIAELRASLAESLRDLDGARAELAIAERHRRAIGRDLGKVWLQRGLVETLAGNAEAALDFYDRAIAEARNGGMVRAAILSAAWCWTEVDNPGMAEYLLARGRRYLARAPIGMRRRWPWITARIADLRGADDTAMALYSEALAAFLKAGVPQESSIIAIDMSALHLRRGEWEKSLEKATQAGRLLVNIPGTAEAMAARILAGVSRDRLATALEQTVAVLLPMRRSSPRKRSPR